MKIVDYKIIFSLETSEDEFKDVTERLSNDIVQAIKTGWILYGPMICEPDTDSRYSRYSQAMVKYENN